MSHVLITGGAGFVGTNLAHRLATLKTPITIYDNLSRCGVEKNLEWLISEHGSFVNFVHGDVRDSKKITKAVKNASAVFHLAAQVAVTDSLTDPVTDFEINARGTLNVLEAARRLDNPPFLLFTSTNKVLGGLEEIQLEELEFRYEPMDPLIRGSGVSEKFGINFCSPYGCSKGAADQYVLDYARCFNFPAVVFRMSCIYGPHQCGTEDQGWVAHFAKQALSNSSVTFYGNGKQVRDALYVDDLVDAFLSAKANIEKTKGQAFNMGGGVSNTISLIELMETLRRLNGNTSRILKDRWRPFDQRYYVSDTRKFSSLTGWRPKVAIAEGIDRLCNWLQNERKVRNQEPSLLEQAA